MSCHRYIHRVHTVHLHVNYRNTCQQNMMMEMERNVCFFVFCSLLEFDTQVLVYFHADFKLLICLKFHTTMYNKDSLGCTNTVVEFFLSHILLHHLQMLLALTSKISQNENCVHSYLQQSLKLKIKCIFFKHSILLES